MPSPRCATRCSAAATATGPRPISRFRASSTSNWRRMARAASMRAARAMPAAISTASSRAGSRSCAAGGEGIRRRFEFQPQRRRRAALQDRAGGAVRGQRHRRARRRRADEGAGQHRTAEQGRRQCLGSIDPAHRGATARRRHLPRRRSSQRGAAQRSGAGGFGGAPLRLPAGRPDPAAGRRRPPRAIAGRRCGVGRAAADASLSNCSRSRPASRSRSCRNTPAVR